MKFWFLLAFFPPLPLWSQSTTGVITSLPTKDSVIALTFDACETETAAYFDSSILSYLVDRHIPFTIFVSGKFAQRNKTTLRELSGMEFVRIENHSLTHHQRMQELSRVEVENEVKGNEDTIYSICGIRTKMFRFPAGNYRHETLDIVQSLGYRVVHWTFESGDPDREFTPRRLTEWVLLKTKPASILIFHINGRGYSTGKALPAIVEELKKRGYRFVLMDNYW